ncbi:glutamate receptor ionotropic, kainate 2-like [Ornithodoros turicata]|uniref:glutamate receptor ionotropic, kainate 2-like n=1 Tax=Ornithodoros turicata TaxID=34597 RepID=UPI003138CAD6
MCRVLGEGVAVVFGPRHVTTASLVHSAVERHQIPHVYINRDNSVPGPDATSLTFAPPQAELGLAVRDLIASQRWSRFTLVYERSEALIHLKEVFHLRRPGDREQVVVCLRPLPPGDDYRPVLRDIAQHGENNIVLDVSASRLADLLKYAQLLGIVTEYHNYIITSLDLHTVDLTEFQSIGVNLTGFQLLNRDLWEDDGRSTLHLNKAGPPVPVFPRSRGPKKLPKVHAALTQDALQALVLGLESVSHLRLGARLPSATCGAASSRPWPYALPLINAIKKLNMVGLTGPIQLDGHGRRANVTLHVVQLKRTGLVSIGTWTLKAGLNITFTYSMVYREVLETLRNRTLRITTLINSPYVMLKRSSNKLNSNDRFEGYCIDLIREISNVLRFNYELRMVRDGAYGSRNAKGEWNGMVRELIDKEADLAIGDLTITYLREEVVDFTMPVMTLGISILFQKPKAEQTLFFFLTPLSVDVWASMAVAYLAISVLLFVVARFSPYEWRPSAPCHLLTSSENVSGLRNHFTLLNSFWFTMSAIMQQGCDTSPRSTSARIIAAVWWFFSFVIISSYTANLASFLTRERMRSPIQSAEDLSKQTEILYGCVTSGSTEAFFRESKFETYEKLWQAMSNADPTVLTESNAEGIKRVRDGNYAFFMESTTVEYVVERDCTLTQIGGLLDSKSYGIAMPSGSPYRTHISSAILQLQEQGTLQILKDRWWKVDSNKRCADDVAQAKSGVTSELGLAKVGGVFVILLAGLGLACIIVFGEFICKTRSGEYRSKLEDQVT